MTTLEGRGLVRGGILLFVLSLLRLGISGVGTRTEYLPSDTTELSRLLAESLDEKSEADRRSAPLRPGETIDPNRDGEEELDRLPGIGPAIARAMVAEREETGGFAGPEDLLRVRGVGPATLNKISPHLDFSQTLPLELHRTYRRDADTGLTTSGPAQDRLGSPGRVRDRILRKVDVNRASENDLQSLPGIGPVLARRIVESREEEGPFHRPDDLLRVRGIGPVALERIRPLVQPGG